MNSRATRSRFGNIFRKNRTLFEQLAYLINIHNYAWSLIFRRNRHGSVTSGGNVTSLCAGQTDFAPPSGDRRPIRCFAFWSWKQSDQFFDGSIASSLVNPFPMYINFLLIYFHIVWWYGSAITCQMFNYRTLQRVILLDDGWYSKKKSTAQNLCAYGSP